MVAHASSHCAAGVKHPLRISSKLFDGWIRPSACQPPSRGRRARCAAAPRGAAGAEQQEAAPAEPCAAARTAGRTATGAPPQVVLTRESGKNGKLLAALQARGVSCLEMPLVETAAGPDRERLADVLRQEDFDWVCITSPEAASVFLQAWRQAGRPAARVAVVGEGTGRVLTDEEGDALAPAFTPSVANAEHFAPELPFLPGGTARVLYPASAKASSQLQEGLEARGFAVLRLNTYDTRPVAALGGGELELAKRAAVVAVASPSAVRAWVDFVGGEAAAPVAVACIGSTSARAAHKLGLTRVYYPEEPSIDNFVRCILQALDASTAAGC